MKNQMKRLFALLLAVMMIMTVVGCAKKTGINDDKMYTYNTYLATCPSNWNELTYQDNNDTEIMGYIGSSFFTYDFKYDDKGEIVPGEFVMQYSAATKLEDVTANYVGEQWGIAEGETAKAYKITLRNDLKWEDGTAIKAEDFVYSMQQQLDPLFQNYRADSFYVGSQIIVGAESYAKQGQTTTTSVGSLLSLEGFADVDAMLAAYGDAPAFINWNYSFGAAYDAATQEWVAPEDAVVDSGMTMKDMVPFYVQNAIAMNGADEATANSWVLDELYVEYTYPEAAWENVGLFSTGDYELVMILAKPLALLKEDGSLSYKAAYNMSSLPLVKKDLYESCKIAPAEGTTLWTTNYNSSVETTASWGPYKLESFQSGTQYVLSRNENWYGYGMKENEGLYQTDRIVVDIIKEWNAAWLKFQAGEIDGIGIDVSIADDYKGSERAYFTPDDFVASAQLQSNVEQLKARETAGVNKSLLGYKDFRQALSLSINRADFATQTTTSSKAGFGLFNSMHYYDVENGGVFRNSDEAKQVLCNVYGVDATQYDSLDDAAAAITGYNIDLARELLTNAYNEALANGDIKETDKVVLTLGTGAINEIVQRRFNYLTEAWKELCVGTPLEGRFETETKDFGTAWANDFRAGAYDVCMGGWSGAAWDPGYFLLAYLAPAYMYSTAWDTSSVQMTFTMKGVGENGEDITETMSLMDWYGCLNGAADAKYNWSEAALPNAQRLQLIAALEEQVLGVYYSVPLYNNFAASLLSYKVDYVTYEYNTFMGYGGVKYMTYNFDDTAWAKEVSEAGGELNYK